MGAPNTSSSSTSFTPAPSSLGRRNNNNSNNKLLPAEETTTPKDEKQKLADKKEVYYQKDCKQQKLQPPSQESPQKSKRRLHRSLSGGRDPKNNNNGSKSTTKKGRPSLTLLFFGLGVCWVLIIPIMNHHHSPSLSSSSSSLALHHNKISPSRAHFHNASMSSSLRRKQQRLMSNNFTKKNNNNSVIMSEKFQNMITKQIIEKKEKNTVTEQIIEKKEKNTVSEQIEKKENMVTKQIIEKEEKKATTTQQQEIVKKEENTVTKSQIDKEEEKTEKIMEKEEKQPTVAAKIEIVEKEEEKTTTAVQEETIKKQTIMPLAFQQILQRAKEHQQHCQTIYNHGPKGFTNDHELDTEHIAIANMTTARLRSFGIIKALEDYYHYNNNNDTSDYPKCVLPPEQECNETQLTVIFMAYNPDRLFKTFKQMKFMLEDEKFGPLVAEVILVWNGPRDVDESDIGKDLISYSQNQSNHLRVVYPLKNGLPNDLMNRYHPTIVGANKTKALLYYDDDGPFYSYEAVLGGFEYWKRHSNAQMGAMSRNIKLNQRQQDEKQRIIQNSSTARNGPHYHDYNKDRFFISHCPVAKKISTYNAINHTTQQEIIKEDEDDYVHYNYNIFPNFEANMVLPSGSILHSNYLCFLWHPALEPIRQFVLDHPVHPDDITVSMIVSQLSGRAPKVYSRRINKLPPPEEEKENNAAQEKENHRKLLFDIPWDGKVGMTDAKHKWAQLRSGAVNSLVRFFGSMNSGSVGWCYGTKFHNPIKNTCDPEFAKIGYYPWMTSNHEPKSTCP